MLHRIAIFFFRFVLLKNFEEAVHAGSELEENLGVPELAVYSSWIYAVFPIKLAEPLFRAWVGYL